MRGEGAAVAVLTSEPNTASAWFDFLRQAIEAVGVGVGFPSSPSKRWSNFDRDD